MRGEIRALASPGTPHRCPRAKPSTKRRRWSRTFEVVDEGLTGTRVQRHGRPTHGHPGTAYDRRVHIVSCRPGVPIGRKVSSEERRAPCSAAQEFDAFITVDRQMPREHDLTRFSIAVVVMRSPSNRLADLQTLVPQFAGHASGREAR